MGRNVQLQVTEQLANFRVLFLKRNIFCAWGITRRFILMWLCTVAWLVVQFPCQASSLHAEEVTPHKSHTIASLQCSGHGWISHHYHRVKQQLGAGKKQMCHKAKRCTWGKAEGRELFWVLCSVGGFVTLWKFWEVCVWREALKLEELYEKHAVHGGVSVAAEHFV
jgi:hypothetical protein